MNDASLGYRRGFVDACLDAAPRPARIWYRRLRQAVDRTISPAAAAVDRQRAYPVESVRVLRELGAFGVCAPKASGGLDFGDAMAALAVETVASGCAASAAILLFHLQVVRRVSRFEHPTHRCEDLPRLARGEWLAASACSESGAEAQRSSLQTRMARQDDHWVIDGAKHYCSGLEGARLFHVLVGVAGDGDRPKPTFVRVSADAAGLDRSEVYDLMGLRGSSTGTVRLNGVSVDADSLVGQVGQGKELMQINQQSLLNPAPIALGTASRALEETREIVLGRIAKSPDGVWFQGTRSRLAELEMALGQAYAYAAETIRRAARGAPDMHVECTKVKLQSTETAVAVADACLRLIGGRGFNAELPFERHLRDAYATVLMGPSHDMIKERVAAQFLAAGCSDDREPRAREGAR
jgi:alkylation response protein AidB-like acyl-CoA dehydrogenase